MISFVVVLLIEAIMVPEVPAVLDAIMVPEVMTLLEFEVKVTNEVVKVDALLIDGVVGIKKVIMNSTYCIDLFI